jgi:hypothetical protein
MKFKIFIVTAIVAGLFAVSVSCKKSETAVTGLTLNKDKDTIKTPGGISLLDAMITPTDAGNKAVTWSTSNAGIATVNSDGTVTSVAPGDVVITAKSVDGGYTAACSIYCSPIDATPPPSPQAVTVHTTQTPGPGDTDGPYEMGMSFTSSKDGKILKIQFYKNPVDIGVHTGIIWSGDGSAKLTTVVFTNETASGWQSATLSTPLNIVKNTVYVVSVNSVGGYVATNNAFDSPIINGPLTGIKGFYSSGGPGTFPTETYENGDYYRDIVFKPNE